MLSVENREEIFLKSAVIRDLSSEQQ
jgi:hypothetical protein